MDSVRFPSRAAFAPRDLARRAADQLARHRRRDGMMREEFELPRLAARETAAALFRRFPKEAYMTRISGWSIVRRSDVTPDEDIIRFEMERLPTAD
jgi:hypothetical protein